MKRGREEEGKILTRKPLGTSGRCRVPSVVMRGPGVTSVSDFTELSPSEVARHADCRNRRHEMCRVIGTPT